jgi:hypothetical protein
MSLRRFTIAEMISVTRPWVEIGNAERLVLESMAGSAGLLRFIEGAHVALLASLSDADAEQLGVLLDDLGLSNLRHDDLARIIFYTMQTHQLLHRGKPEARAILDTQTVMFPDGLQIVRASYRESAGRAQMRSSQLNDERRTLLAGIPVQGATLLELMTEWNQVGTHLGTIQDQRATPSVGAGERPNGRQVRDRWVRVVRAVMTALELEATERPEAGRILDRIANIQAEVGRRLRAGSGRAPDESGEGGEDDDAPGTGPGEDPADELLTPGAESR